MSKHKKKNFLIIGILLFVVSLACESFTTTKGPQNGLTCFLLGWLAVLTGEGIAWLANPFLILAWIIYFFAKTRKGQVFVCGLTILAILLMLTFLMTSALPMDEGGNPYPIIHIGIGYWLWVLSGAFTLMAAMGNLIKDTSELEWAAEDYKHLTSVLAKRDTRDE